jgi:tRNA-dihydrouridine synthase B
LPLDRFVYIFGLMPLNFKQNQTVILAPAAGITDSITRKIAIKWGADATITELISSEGLIRNCKRTKSLMSFEDSERPIAIQLFGANPDNIAQAAVIASTLNPDSINLNFGCPAKKIVVKNGGASLLLNLSLLEKIIKKVVDAVTLPVTIKYRSGWDNSNIVAVEVAKIAEDNGVSAVCLHPRTKVQGFADKADWSLIGEVKHSVNIPVIGSGDIDSPQKAKLMFDTTGCDAAMVCQASFGRPWIFKRIKHYLQTGQILPQPDISTKISTALEHLSMSIQRYGSWPGLIRMRNQLTWYLKDLPGASKIRAKMVMLTSEEDIKNLLENYKQELIAKRYEAAENKENTSGCKIG